MFEIASGWQWAKSKSNNILFDLLKWSAPFNYANIAIYRDCKMYFRLFWSLGDGIKGLKAAQTARKSWRKSTGFWVHTWGTMRAREGWRGRQRRGWTVQYPPDKGQRHVLFMMEAAAAVEASGPRLLRACVLIPHEKMLRSLGQASGHAHQL